MSLNGRKIVLGITGGIAAYKCGQLCRDLQRAGATVQVVLTPAAQAFVTPMTLQALTGRPVRMDLLDPAAEQGMGHIELARWADTVLIAPASADFLARMAAGMANDLLSTLVLATRAPIVVAPAMNQQMWANAATQANLRRLDELYSPQWIGPDSGDQACGEFGSGRMSEPAAIVAGLEASDAADRPQPLSGRRILITAGPTRETIDPVRYLTNRSSGKMGFALAEAAAALGAKVGLVAGPVSLTTPPGVVRYDVETAVEMADQVDALLPDVDAFIGAAAVSDYRVSAPLSQKHKKPKDEAGNTGWTLQLVENPDIIAGVAASPRRPALVVGFAAETEKLEDHARSKLERKKLDWVVANSVGGVDSGFESDRNAAVLLGAGGQRIEYPAQAKKQLALAILQTLFASESPKNPI